MLRKNITAKLAVTALSLSMMGIPTSVPAYAGTVDAILKTGGVQISLEQKMLDENGDRVDPYDVHLHPTEEVSYIVSVKNNTVICKSSDETDLQYVGRLSGATLSVTKKLLI